MEQGQRFGRYTLLRQLAAGGMGELWVARMEGQDGFQKTVALKMVLPHLAKDRYFLDMFLDEARLCARLVHPNICQVFELDHIDKIHFIAMEFLRGIDLSQLEQATVERQKPLPVPLLARIIADAAAGLDYAHSLTDPAGQPFNLVHRDISPHNIFVTYDGSVKVIDFGIAKARGRISSTESGMIKGKYAYMSPEQTVGAELDRRSDVFALGVVFYELLTHKPLFRGDSPLVTVELVRQAHVVPPSVVEPSVPSTLDPIVLKALARDPASRWATAHEMRMAIEDWLSQEHANASSAHLLSFLRQAEVEQFVAVGAQLDETPELPAERLSVADERPDDIATSASRRQPPAPQLAPAVLVFTPKKKSRLWAAPVAAGVFAIAALSAAYVLRPGPVDRTMLDVTFGPGLGAPAGCKLDDADVPRVQRALASANPTDALIADKVAYAAEYSALLARAALESGGRLEVASAAAGEATALCPQWALPQHLVGKAAQAADRLADAEAGYRTAIKLSPDWEAPKFNLALVLLSKPGGKPEEAIALLDQVIDNVADYPRAHLVRGQAHLMAKQFGAAVVDLQRAVAANPADEAAKRLLVTAQQRK